MERGNYISFKELSAILHIKDYRTLQSTKDFPVPIVNKEEILFPKKEVLKYFNVDNFDEPFINLAQASKLFKIRRLMLIRWAYNGRIPAYQLKKNLRGSKFLFKKS